MSTTRENINFDDMFVGYMMAALWSTNDESNDAGGEPMDANYGIEDIDPNTVAKMRADCEAFVASIPDADLDLYFEQVKPHGSIESQMGHDYWLTRNGHGVGFNDRGLEALGERIHDLCSWGADVPHAGEVSLYVGDDKRIHQ